MLRLPFHRDAVGDLPVLLARDDSLIDQLVRVSVRPRSDDPVSRGVIDPRQTQKLTLRGRIQIERMIGRRPVQPLTYALRHRLGIVFQVRGRLRGFFSHLVRIRWRGVTRGAPRENNLAATQDQRQQNDLRAHGDEMRNRRRRFDELSAFSFASIRNGERRIREIRTGRSVAGSSPLVMTKIKGSNGAAKAVPLQSTLPAIQKGTVTNCAFLLLMQSGLHHADGRAPGARYSAAYRFSEIQPCQWSAINPDNRAIQDLRDPRSRPSPRTRLN